MVAKGVAGNAESDLRGGDPFQDEAPLPAATIRLSLLFPGFERVNAAPALRKLLQKDFCWRAFPDFLERFRPDQSGALLSRGSKA